MELLAIAGAILQDHSPHPVFPRWVGYFNIWAAISFTPVVLLIFFKKPDPSPTKDYSCSGSPSP
ncbi:MAG: hypothetical protein ACYDHH_28160 [Solirubrobacteraceae bacterium]